MWGAGNGPVFLHSLRGISWATHPDGGPKIRGGKWGWEPRQMSSFGTILPRPGRPRGPRQGNIEGRVSGEFPRLNGKSCLSLQGSDETRSTKRPYFVDVAVVYSESAKTLPSHSLWHRRSAKKITPWKKFLPTIGLWFIKTSETHKQSDGEEVNGSITPAYSICLLLDDLSGRLPGPIPMRKNFEQPSS